MTETASHVAVGPVGSDWREGIVGRLLPGVEVEVDPSSSRLVVGGPMLMAGDLTADAGLRADGRFVTGDLGEFLADGRLRILGRADDVIVTAGVNVHPQAVEDVLASCPGVAAVAVTARRDARWGTTLVALFEGDVDPATLDRWARERIDPAARPRAYLRVAALPRNAMGKLVRHELPALLTGEAGDR
jgi:O-succinylbenzoic acid--CoA ligase